MSGKLAQADVDAITSARESFVTAISNDDAEGMVALLTEDGQAYPSHEPALVGRDANRAWHEERISEFRTDFKITPDELIVEGPMAFERFSYTLRLTPKAGGEPAEETGRCFWLWRREEGSWKVARAMWNSPQPLPSDQA